MDKNIIFLPENDEGSKYTVARVLNNNGGGIVIGEHAPAICVVEYLLRILEE